MHPAVVRYGASILIIHTYRTYQFRPPSGKAYFSHAFTGMLHRSFSTISLINTTAVSTQLHRCTMPISHQVRSVAEFAHLFWFCYIMTSCSSHISVRFCWRIDAMLPGLPQPHLHTYHHHMLLASIISHSDYYWKAVVAYTWHIYASGSV